MRMKGAEAGNRLQTAVGVAWTALQGEDFGKSAPQNFTPDYKKYIGLGDLGTSIICSKWHTPIVCLHTWQQDPITKFLV